MLRGGEGQDPQAELGHLLVGVNQVGADVVDGDLTAMPDRLAAAVE